MLGKEWNDNKNGTDSCFWGRYEEDTYYSNDTGYAMSKAFCERLHYTIYDFEDIDLTK